MAKKTGIGNPAVIMSALEVAKTEQGQKAIKKTFDRVENTQRTVKKVGKYAAIGVGSAIAIYATVKVSQGIRRKALLNKAVGDPEIKSAVDIWNCIPDGYKNKFKLIELNPLKRVSYAYEEIETLWKDVNTARLMSIAKSIYTNKLKINRISRVFNTLYRIDLLTLLNKVLTPAQIDMFSNYIYRGSGSVSPAVSKGLFAVAKEDVRLRTEAKIPGFLEKENVIRTAKSGSLVGQVTGREETFVDGDKSVVFVEILSYNSSTNANKYSKPVWAWKGAFNFVSKNETSKLPVTDTHQSYWDTVVKYIPAYHLIRKIL